MAHVVSFKIGGLVGKKEVYEKILNRDINIFFGPNGSGKTSLLKILNSALANDGNALQFVPFEWAEVTIHSVNYNADFVARVKNKRYNLKTSKTVDSFNADDIFDIDKQLRRSVLDANQVPLKWEYINKLPKDFTARCSWGRRYLPATRIVVGYSPMPSSVATQEHDADSKFADELKKVWLTYSNKRLREVETIQGEGIANIFRSFQSISLHDPTITNKFDSKKLELVKSFLERQGINEPSKFKKKRKVEDIFEVLVNDIGTIEKNINEKNASQDKLEELINSLFQKSKKIEFSSNEIKIETQDGKELPLYSLSSGEKQVLRLLMEVLFAEESSMIIDEPELSLHIDWQRHLISSMRQLNSNAQLIVATHSPEIMADIDDTKIFKI